MVGSMVKLATDAYVDGKWLPGSRRFVVRDPFDDAPIAEVTAGDGALADLASEAAARAFASWRTKPAPERGKLLAALGARMIADVDRLAALCTRENGKALSESVGEVRYAASFLSWFAGEAERAYGEAIPASNTNQRLMVHREPVGPCALITPWNFPYAMLTRKLGAALAAGCTAVAKPAAQTPLSALALAELAEAVGIPPGVINIVPTDEPSSVVGRWIASPAIRKVGFTGSTEVGRTLLRQCADDLKRVSLELGGNAPFVVLADADLDAAVAGAMIAKFRNAGQSCVAANRFVLDTAIAQPFTKKLVAAISKLKVGRGSDPGVDLGPLIDDNAVAKLRRLINDALEKGAQIVHGSQPGTSRLVAPIVLDGITAEMAIWREEIFGPVVALRTAANETDALVQANDSEYGLVAYVYTRDAARQQRFVDGLATGMVGVNEGLVSTAQAPFGGIKHSGFGREGSRHGLDDYTALKYVATRV
ncbi:MAG: NAD-dependent succinate-semialdehyde dehydrogenase [Deltaproteobacteria bacterium]|nr:NAD-dependent succinate-semialdehyde dehydrogenase [Deltaproteobacteria bacterium]